MHNFYKGYKGARKSGYDYSKAGFYFITIDCWRMECRFGEIIMQKLILTEFGKIACREWDLIPVRFTNVRLHEFQIMPNHLHAIIEITDEVNQVSIDCMESAKKKSLSDIVGTYKSLVSNECLLIHKERYKDHFSIPWMGKIWQRSFNDKIIRDTATYKSLARYIRNNPRKWNKL
jgi:REP element-mobilizing transposase RayT